MFDSFFNSIFLPLLNSIGVFWFVFVISLFVSLITVVVYKYTTNQNLMKQLKGEIKELQEKMKKSRDDMKKTMQYNSQMMEKNMAMMKHSMGSTLYTIIPIIILFGWLTAHLAYIPLTEDVQFTITITFDDYKGTAMLSVPKGLTIVDEATKNITSSVDWRLSGKPGEYLVSLKVGDKTYDKDITISNDHQFAPAVKNVNDGIVKSIQINYKKQIVMNLFGWRLGWLGTYILLALVFSIVLRKILNVH